ncbi:hypothetical protein F7U66_01740 [Vibrio parahaemolyticus]|nr:hypothetical protein [Vibrio parahaemolyticus]
MNSLVKGLFVVGSVLLSAHSIAGKYENINIPAQTSRIKIEEVKTQDTTTSSFSDTLHFDVDGVRIELTKEDKVKAKNWRLTHQDWAKYKYVMEFMPRGTWTPDLDPPMVLGNLAKSEFERNRFAKIAMNLEIDRRQRESAFMTAGEEYLRELSPQMGSPKKLEGLEFYLGAGKTKLRSLFVDADNCDEICESFVRDAFSGTAHSTQLYVYVSAARQADAQRWIVDGVLSADDIERKSVKLLVDSERKYRDYIGDGQMPFFVHQTDDRVKVIHSKKR